MDVTIKASVFYCNISVMFCRTNKGLNSRSVFSFIVTSLSRWIYDSCAFVVVTISDHLSCKYSFWVLFFRGWVSLSGTETQILLAQKILSRCWRHPTV